MLQMQDIQMLVTQQPQACARGQGQLARAFWQGIQAKKLVNTVKVNMGQADGLNNQRPGGQIDMR